MSSWTSAARRPAGLATKGDHAPRSAVVAAAMSPRLTPAVWSVARSHRGPAVHAFLVTQGQASFTATDAAALDLVAPALLWLPRDAAGVFRLEAGSEGFTCTVAEDLVWRILGDGPMLATLRPLLDRIALASGDRLLAGFDEIRTVFAALVREARGAQAGAAAMMGFHLGLLMLHLWRASAETPATAARGTGPTTVQRFQQAVELHYRDDLGIADFARLLGVTRTHLHDACLRTTGRTPLTLVHHRLIEEARIRLEQTDLPVEQVGYSLGFRDPAYFNRFFKRLTGVAPGQHRRASTGVRPTGEPPSFAAWP